MVAEQNKCALLRNIPCDIPRNWSIELTKYVSCVVCSSHPCGYNLCRVSSTGGRPDAKNCEYVVLVLIAFEKNRFDPVLSGFLFVPLFTLVAEKLVVVETGLFARFARFAERSWRSVFLV